MTLAETLRFLIATLIRWSQRRQYGELRVIVRAGQIQAVHETSSYQGSLPNRIRPEQAAEAVQAAEDLARTL